MFQFSCGSGLTINSASLASLIWDSESVFLSFFFLTYRRRLHRSRLELISWLSRWDLPVNIGLPSYKPSKEPRSQPTNIPRLTSFHKYYHWQCWGLFIHNLRLPDKFHVAQTTLNFDISLCRLAVTWHVYYTDNISEIHWTQISQHLLTA